MIVVHSWSALFTDTCFRIRSGRCNCRLSFATWEDYILTPYLPSPLMVCIDCRPPYAKCKDHIDTLSTKPSYGLYWLSTSISKVERPHVNTIYLPRPFIMVRIDIVHFHLQSGRTPLTPYLLAIKSIERRLEARRLTHKSISESIHLSLIQFHFRYKIYQSLLAICQSIT